VDEGHERALQRLRTLLVASLALCLAAGAHVGGGGRLPDPLLLLLTGALVLAGASVLGRRRLRHRTLLPVLGLGQVLLHLALTALAVPAAAPVATAVGTGAHAGHAHDLLPPLGGGAVDAVAETASAGMVVAHVLATVATALAAVAADRAWASAVDRLTRLFPALLVLLAGVVAAPAPRARRTRQVRTALPRAVVLSTRPRRGPPPAPSAV